MAKWALIRDETVAEFRELAVEEIPPHKMYLYRPVEEVGAGPVETIEVLADKVVITRSTPPVQRPDRVTPYQARIALLNAGLLESVNTAVAAAPESVKLAWEYATTVERESPMIAALAETLAITPEQLDQLFIAAAQVT